MSITDDSISSLLLLPSLNPPFSEFIIHILVSNIFLGTSLNMFLHCLKFSRSALISFHYLSHFRKLKHSNWNNLEFPLMCHVPTCLYLLLETFLFLLQFYQSDFIRLVCISYWSLKSGRFYQSLKGKLSILHIYDFLVHWCLNIVLQLLAYFCFSFYIMRFVRGKSLSYLPKKKKSPAWRKHSFFLTKRNKKQ